MRVWTLVGFLERLDQWVQIEQPSVDLRIHVTQWILTRMTEPYQGVRRAPGFDNLWFGAIPASGHGDGLAVLWSYWIWESDGTLRCDSFASLGLPI